MILADTSVWVDHFRRGLPGLAAALDEGQILAHPWVVGELALGGVSDSVQHLLTQLPEANVAIHDEMMTLIAEQLLSGTGVGYIDVQLLAATLLTADRGSGRGTAALPMSPDWPAA